jgi:predicted secreted hydrolase
MSNIANYYLDYNIETGEHRSAEQEWGIHNPQTKSFMEWHYWTCIMEGTNGDRFFFFFCDFNMTAEVNQGLIKAFNQNYQTPKDKLVFMGQTLLSNYTKEHFFSDVDIAIMNPEDAFDPETNTKKFTSPRYQVELTYKGDDVIIKANGPNYNIELKGTGGKKIMWAKDSLNKEGLIRQGAELDRSFYYSLPNIPFSGKLSYTNDKENLKTEIVGRGWVDKQWGDFTSKAWEWSSFRFADGDRINMYNFAGGYQIGTYMKADGTCEYFDKFTVYQNGYAKTEDGTWFSHGWSYDLPVKGKNYRVEPLSDKNTIIAPGNSFFEGIGKLLDKNGEQVGWSVNESMDVRVMQNAPGDKYQNNQL